MELESGVERCSEGSALCSPFVGAGVRRGGSCCGVIAGTNYRGQ
jgi:hypothetical protein